MGKGEPMKTRGKQNFSLLQRMTALFGVVIGMTSCLQVSIISPGSTVASNNNPGTTTATATPASAAAGFLSLHVFQGTNGTGNNGANPRGLLLSGTTLYGLATSGGVNNFGTIFSMNLDGSSAKTLYSFSGSSDGQNPYGALIISGTTLYGTTFQGGAFGFGTLFSFDTSTSTFTTLWSFSGGNDGKYSEGSLILSGTMLYGLSVQGGASNLGTLFSFNLSTATFTTMHSFTGGNDGKYPEGALLLSGTKLYGLTASDNINYAGTLFSFDLIASTFTPLHQFVTASDGSSPAGNLIISGTTLYGVATDGGANSSGTLFSFDTSASTFTVLHSFGSGSDGINPYIGLTLSGTTLYGVATNGGANGSGTLFSFNTSNSTYSTLYSFLGTSDGANPYATLMLSGTTFYGVATLGGLQGNGTIFSFDTSTSTFTTLYSFTSGNDGSTPLGSLTILGSTLYGLTRSGGGSGNAGTIFSSNLDGSNFTILHSFTNGSDGGFPDGSSLLLSGTTLYGMTYEGGTNNTGTIFSFDTTTSTLSTLYNFTGGNDGAYPSGSLIMSGTVLYGMTPQGGANSNGNIFSFDTSTSTFLTLYSFSSAGDGSSPYGMTSQGGANGVGTIFSFNTNTSTFSNLYSFTGGNDGAYPYGSLIISGTTLYGMNYQGGASGGGTIFSFNTNTSAFSTLYSFTGGNDGENPQGSLILSGTNLYGLTTTGGANGYGTIFSVDTSNSALTALYSFSNGSDGGNPEGSLILSGATLYGMCSYGGSARDGTVFGFGLLGI
jgi:uncharacterized repeat protein (TIGR03803 family)